MAELVVIGFDNPHEADRVLTELARLQREYLVDLEDAVVAIRAPDGRLQLKQSVDLVGAGAASGSLWGAMWGSLVGLLFLNPLLGLAAGAALGAGAVAAVVGTRFLCSDESRAHSQYKRRCLEADTTVLTELFGLGWPDAPHRVIPNAATERWLGDDPRGPGWIRAANRLTVPAVRRLPHAVQARALRGQRPSLPFLSPRPPTDDGPDSLLDSGPLYAGANVSRIAEIRPAAQLLAALTP